MPDKSQKTEKATPKKRKDSRKKGQVGKSMDLSKWIGLILGISILLANSSSIEKQILGLEGSCFEAIAHPSSQIALRLLERGLLTIATILAPLALALMIVGVVINAAQVGGLSVSFYPLKPTFSKLSLFKGFKRLFSANSAWEAAKSLLKATIIGLLAYQVVSSSISQLMPGAILPLSIVLAQVKNASLSMIRTAGIIGFILAIFDLIHQKKKTSKDLRMSKQEIKDESRQSEGDPTIKGAIRSRQLKLSRSRMLSEVVNADVVITNPTHLAIALRYDPSVSQAPIVIAKGADHMAAKIKEKAAKHNIPILEDKPLARAIYAVCEIDDSVPPEVYVAVAKVLAFVYSLPSKKNPQGFTSARR